MNITQKLYNKIHLNSYYFLYTLYFSIVTSQTIFSCISTSSLSCIHRIISKMKLLKTSLVAQLKQTNLGNRLHNLTESRKEGFNDTGFQHFVDELKHCSWDMPMDLQLLVPVFLCLYSIYLVAMLSFKMMFL